MHINFCTGIPKMGHSIETCCEAHDKCYSGEIPCTRFQADIALFYCLTSQGRYIFALIAFAVVRSLGWIFWKGSTTLGSTE